MRALGAKLFVSAQNITVMIVICLIDYLHVRVNNDFSVTFHIIIVITVTAHRSLNFKPQLSSAEMIAAADSIRLCRLLYFKLDPPLQSAILLLYNGTENSINYLFSFKSIDLIVD